MQTDQKLLTRNHNLDLLKMLCAFLVIVVHFGQESHHFIRSLGGFAVPIFMILSFYFFWQKITSIDIAKRIKKLFIPMVGWAIIYFIVYKVFLGINGITISSLIWQTITGHVDKLNASMWFQNNLIILTIFTFIIFKKFKNNFFKIMLCCCFLAYLLEYSDINYILYENLRSRFKYPLGRLTEMVPYMVIGLVLAKYNILNYFRGKYTSWWLALFIFMNSFIFINAPKGFGYGGIKYAIMSVLLILLFNSLPQNSKIYRNTLILCTQNTLGIYCIHRLVEKILHPYVFIEYNLSYCLIIFVVSWFVCYSISKIPSKNIQALVK